MAKKINQSSFLGISNDSVAKQCHALTHRKPLGQPSAVYPQRAYDQREGGEEGNDEVAEYLEAAIGVRTLRSDDKGILQQERFPRPRRRSRFDRHRHGRVAERKLPRKLTIE